MAAVDLDAALSANSSVTATCTRTQAFLCAMTANSAVSVTAMDVMYIPPPNVPMPLPVPAVVPLRVVPSPPVPPSTVVSPPSRTRRSRFE